MKTLAIIGGGAAGLVAAISAAEYAARTQTKLDITIFEADEKIGRSILASGNGRCNFSNAQLDVSQYHHAAFAQEVLDALEQAFGDDADDGLDAGDNADGVSFDLDPVHAFFASHGLVWRQEPDGRQYPRANKASAVLDVLRAALAFHSINVTCGFEIASLDPPRAFGRGQQNRWTLKSKQGVFARADAVILACGGKRLQAVQLETRQLPVQTPLLGPLATNLHYVKQLDNIRVRCKVALKKPYQMTGVTITASSGSDEADDASTALNAAQATADGLAAQDAPIAEVGELLFRKYGVSGICVFNLSRYAQVGDYLIIDFLNDCPGLTAYTDFAARVETLNRTFGKAPTYADVLRGLVLPQVGHVLLQRCKLRDDDTAAQGGLERLWEVLRAFPLEVAGIADESICQVHRGGVQPDKVHAKTLEMLGYPGLFIAGEALDVDGPCGGYNLHWAWACGLLAGRSAAAGLIAADQQG